MKYKRVITLDGNKIVGTKEVGENCVLSDNDMLSDIGEIGQLMQEDGTFIDDHLDVLKAELAEVNSQLDTKFGEINQANVLGDLDLVVSLTAEYDALVIQAISLEYEISQGVAL